MIHLDISHFLTNLIIGSFFIYFLGIEIGFIESWFFTFLSGIFANLLNIIFHQVNFNSIGFSTAVFGCIGILSGLKINYKQNNFSLIPLFSGLSFLLLFGTSEKSDIFGHFFGFIIGILIGIFLLKNLKFIEKYNIIIDTILFLLLIFIILNPLLLILIK